MAKQYYAEDRPVAMDIGGRVYYHLYDPTGLSLALVNEQGEVAQVIYDAYGEVLVSTLTPDLVTVLGGQGVLNDPATDLTYLGNGRYYDPNLGRPLQPNPVGGAPVAPQSLNRYTATPLGQPGVAEGVGSTWIPFNDPVLSNVGKAGLSLSLSEATARGLMAYSRASAYVIPGRPIWGNRTVLVSANPLIERALVGVGIVGLAARDVVGAPPRSLRARLFNAGSALFEQAALWNSDEVTSKVIIGYEFSYGHRLPAGRAVGRLATLLNFNKAVSHGFDFGLGLGIDIGYQAWMDYGNPYLSGEQFRGRLIVSGFGSGTSFFTGVVAASLAETAGISAVGVLGGPAGWIGLGVGITVAIVWDIWVTPVVYDRADLNPSRQLAPLQ